MFEISTKAVYVEIKCRFYTGIFFEKISKKIYLTAIKNCGSQ